MILYFLTVQCLSTCSELSVIYEKTELRKCEIYTDLFCVGFRFGCIFLQISAQTSQFAGLFGLSCFIIIFWYICMAKPSRKEQGKYNKSAVNPTQTVQTKVASRVEQPTARAPKGTAEMPFRSQNYLWLGICFALIVVAYALMRIENAEDGFLALYICPVLLGAGYLGVFYALFKK